MLDPEDLSPEARAYLEDLLERAKTDLEPKMRRSAVVVSIAPDRVDPKFALETGYALLLDKPIVVVVAPGTTLNEGLRRAATDVVALDHPLDSMAGQAQLQAGIEAAMRRLDEKEEEEGR